MPEDLELQLASRASATDRTDELQLKQVQRRIASLPALDLPVRMKGFITLLEDANGSMLPVELRSRILALLDGEMDGLLTGYRREIRHHSFPLPEQPTLLYTDMQALLTGIAASYKRLILDLVDQQGDRLSSSLLRDTVLRCVEYLSQQALQAYVVYQDPPAGIWQDLHRLYRYAEKKQLETEIVEHLSDLSISGAYARALLLSIANPYHLMQGEIHQTWERLKKWALAVRIEHPDELPPDQVSGLISGRFYCDLAGNSAPAYGIEELADTPGDPRLLNLEEVLKIIRNRMKTLALNMQRSLQVRSEWDLLHRLRSAWENRATREDSRQSARGTTVKAIVGFSSCHYFFTGYAPFAPEQSEIAIHGDKFHESQTLSLVPSDETPWLDAEARAKLEAGVIKPRSYRFDVEDRENDVWKKAHTSGPRKETELERKLEERTLGTLFEFRLINSSAHGTGLESLPRSSVQLRVGDLVAAFPHGDEGDGDPVLNVIRWIHCRNDHGLQIGLHQIDGDATPVAVRALDKEARFRDYTKGFLVEGGTGDRSLIVPAEQFERDSLILVNNGEQRLCSVKLRNLLGNTRAFSRFGFNLVEPDQQLTDDMISSLKKLLYDEL